MAALQPSPLARRRLPGRKLALQRRAGAGATAAVWLARDGERELALKLAESADLAPALACEAIHASLALSPRLPELLDVGFARRSGQSVELFAEANGDDERRPYLALRWVAGSPLRAEGDEAARASLALRVARDAGEALADLHDVGLAHGDIKPDNILIGRAGRASLVDLGLSGPAGALQPKGGTPRYLGRGDRELGDARARDLLALGIVLAEIAVETVAGSDEPLVAARRAVLPPSLARLVGALLAPAPGARPSARWVHELACAALGSSEQDERFERWRRSVRACYLRLRRREIAEARDVTGEVAPWLAGAVDVARRARLLSGEQGERTLAPLSIEERRRWLVALVGNAAVGWPLRALAEASEPALARALEELAARKRPLVWTLADVEAALAGAAPAPEAPSPALARFGPARATHLALRVTRLPLDAGAVETVERFAEQAPPELVVATADALRLAGELGRARSLVLDQKGGAPIVADVLRRSGDLEQAAVVAERAVADGEDPDDRARACLARIRLDAGAHAAAEALVTGRSSAAAAEVAALVAMAQGDRGRAIEHAERGMALAENPEARARLAAALAWARTPRATSGHASDALAARESYRRAVEYAVQAGAVLEEASYRTGEAANCVDLGELGAALETAERAALLWEEVLARPAMAARAWLASAAAQAAVGARHEACRAAEHAIERAALAGDARAELFGCWTLADACPPGDDDGRRAAERAAALVEDDAGDEWLHTAARLLRHDPSRWSAERIASLDAAAAHTGALSPYARATWWWARAETLQATGRAADADAVLAELTSLADADIPVATRARAMHAGAELAAAGGDSARLARLETARAEAAQRLVEGAGPALAEAVRACPWAARHAEAAATPMAREQALDLQQLVRALSERRSLRALLDRVIDVLLLWTGAERGLLLLRGAEGGLVPRSARNLGRDDLRGEQLTVSSSLAERALESGEPVVAIDAMEELSKSYRSVHALKLRSVLVLPLAAQGEVLGVAYLDDRVRRGAFGERELAWAQAVAPIAALAIADARAQVRLRRAVRRAERATKKLEETLAHKETALDVAERELARAVRDEDTRFRYEGIIGQSESMSRVLRLVDRVAASDIPVLLRGESGSGKELVARAIHRKSSRGERAFVSENCGALPETLLESALFGHVKGAFTGAHRPRVGLFEAAHEGTLFLDEIGEMSLGMQTKLLRVLEDSIVRPVGSTRSHKVNVRIIAATHRDLEQMVAEGSFREDLYYRLNVITVQIPSLRERRSDIPLIAEHLIAKHAGGRSIRLTRAAAERLAQQPWPGNVRQLENEIRRALLLCEDVIDLEQLSIEGGHEGSAADDLGLDVRARIDRLETELVQEALERTRGNQTQAAKLLGVSRYGLHKMMKRLGIRAQRDG